MFDKLKLKFILINMSLLTTVFISIFGTIYFMTNSSLNRDINETLHSLMVTNHKPKPNYSNIIVDVDDNGLITKSFISFNLSIDYDYLQDIVSNILKEKNNSDKITINDEPYIFLKKSDSPFSKIVLLNVSYQENLKSSLLKIFLFVGTISLIVLLIISIYLTNKSIKPIKLVFEKQKQFIADASHELKTPLTIIKTNTSLILSNPDDTIKNQSKWINYINLQTDRMSELVTEMLSLAKLDSENNNLVFTKINISKIIESMILQFDAIIFENNITLNTNISKDIFINGDKESIKKLFSIIMDNAIKHTSNNGEIHINLYSEKNTLRLSIKNTGLGIPSEHLEKIFERFYRVDTSRVRDTGGYGLGLSIAKSIVEQHKGKIYAQSTLNKDTTFFIELPIKF